MIRVTIELWPGGDPARTRTLGTIDIINTGDHPQHPRKGHYIGRFFTATGRATFGKAGQDPRVEDHARKGLPVFCLLRKILERAGY